MSVKTELKDRLSFKTTPKLWAKVRNVAGIVAGIGGVLISPICPFTLGVTAVAWIQFTVAISTTVAVNSHLTKESTVTED